MELRYSTEHLCRLWRNSVQDDRGGGHTEAYISQMGTKWNLQLDEHAQNIREKLWKEQKKHMIMNM